MTDGEEAIRHYAPKTGWHKYFCGECGSALFTRNPDDDAVGGMRMGRFDEDPASRPRSPVHHLRAGVGAGPR